MMKKWLVIISLSLNLSGFYFLNSTLVYAQGFEEIELGIENLKAEIGEEEEAIETLRKRYSSILRKKQRLQSIIKQEEQRIERIEKARQDRLRRFQARRQRVKERVLREQERRFALEEARKQRQERLKQRKFPQKPKGD